MSWNLSTGFVTALQNKRIETGTFLNANTLSLGTNAINDSASGLGSFKVGDFVHVVSATNKNVIARVVTASAASITFAANTFTAESSGMNIFIHAFKGGSFAEVLKNGRLDLYSGARPADADATETGTLLASITMNGGAFVAGVATNGLNVNEIVAGVLKRAIDPATGSTEIWKGDGIAAGTTGWGRWHSNDVVTGASTSAIRIDGTVSTVAGGDIVMANGRDIVVGSPATVTDVNVSVTGV